MRCGRSKGWRVGIQCDGEGKYENGKISDICGSGRHIGVHWGTLGAHYGALNSHLECDPKAALMRHEMWVNVALWHHIGTWPISKVMECDMYFGNVTYTHMAKFYVTCQYDM